VDPRRRMLAAAARRGAEPCLEHRPHVPGAAGLPAGTVQRRSEIVGEAHCDGYRHHSRIAGCGTARTVNVGKEQNGIGSNGRELRGKVEGRERDGLQGRMGAGRKVTLGWERDELDCQRRAE
jgi:hypothetical protein